MRHAPRWISKEVAHVHRKIHLFASHGSLADAHLSAMCEPIPRRALCQTVPLFRPIPRHGFCATDFTRESSRESLRDIEACLRAHQNKLYHMGIRSTIVARNTLSKANEHRNWRIYADFAQSLIRTARPLYAEEDLGLDLDNTIYALDSSTIDLCLSVFPWALFRSTKSAVKLHTLLDLRGNIPTFIHISDGKLHDVNMLDILMPEPGAFYIMDRGYVDFERLFALNITGAFFVIRAKSNTQYRRLYSRPTKKMSGVKCDQTIVLTGVNTTTDYPQPLRRVKYHDAQTGKTFICNL